MACDTIPEEEHRAVTGDLGQERLRSLIKQHSKGHKQSYHSISVGIKATRDITLQA